MGLFNLLVHLVEGDDIRIVIFLHTIERAKLTIHVADVRVIHVAVHDVGDDLIAATVVFVLAGDCRRRSASAPQSSSGQTIEPQRSAWLMRWPFQTFWSKFVERRVVDHRIKLAERAGSRPQPHGFRGWAGLHAADRLDAFKELEGGGLPFFGEHAHAAARADGRSQKPPRDFTRSTAK